MVDRKQSQKPISSTSAFFVVGNSPHERFEDLTKKLLNVPKEELYEKRVERKKARSHEQG